MPANPTKAARKALAEENRKYGDKLIPLSPHTWEHLGKVDQDAFASYREHRVKVWRSRHLLVQGFEVRDTGQIRLSVCRAEIGRGGRWKDGLTWDELQTVKRECGYGDCCAVEVYPPDADVVNVANMRHLWVYPKGAAPAFIWRTE